MDCGGNADFTSPEGILWKMDDLNFIDHTPGLAASVGGNSSLVLPRELQTLRYFPASASPRKSCYRVGLESENDLQLIRVGFLYGNYDQLDHPPSFFISLDNDYWAFVQLKSGLEPVYFEALTVIPQASLSVCLMRVNGSGAPLINSIEVRMLQSDTYRAYAKGNQLAYRALLQVCLLSLSTAFCNLQCIYSWLSHGHTCGRWCQVRGKCSDCRSLLPVSSESKFRRTDSAVSIPHQDSP